MSVAARAPKKDVGTFGGVNPFVALLVVARAHRRRQGAPQRSHTYEQPRPADQMYNSYKKWLKGNLDTSPRLAADPTAQRRLRDEIENPTPNIRPTSERANINSDMRETSTTRTAPVGGGQQDSDSSEAGSGTGNSERRDDRGGNNDRKDSSNSGSKKKDDNKKKKSEQKKKKRDTQAQKKRKRQNRERSV